MPAHLTAVTYNVHQWVGMDKFYDPGRGLSVLQEMCVDIIGLQEVNFPKHIRHRITQTQLASELGMELILGETLVREQAAYGNVLLTSLPVVDVRRHDISVPSREPRGVLDVDLGVVLGGRAETIRVLYGCHNRITAKKKAINMAGYFVAQFKNLIVLLLAVAAGVSFALGQMTGRNFHPGGPDHQCADRVWTELRAIRSMEALQQMTRMQAKVLRQGKIQEILASNCSRRHCRSGRGRYDSGGFQLIESNRIQADESALTGESVPVARECDVLAEDTSLGERTNMLFKGTALTQGSGKGLVVSTGMSTELGHISQLAEGAEEDALTPLEQRLNKLGQKLIWITLGIAGLIGLDGHVCRQGSGFDLQDLHRPGRCRHPGRPAHRGHHCPGPGDVAHGPEKRPGQSAIRGGNPRIDQHHLHGQDRDLDRKQDDGLQPWSWSLPTGWR
jgi:hypothetical protein